MANKAIMLDMKDAQSWCKCDLVYCVLECFCVDVLGNAHMTNYFTNKQEIEQLTMALKAYSQTE